MASRRSDADGRDVYYVLDLERARAAGGGGGAASSRAGRAAATVPRSGGGAPTVAGLASFLCTGNSARSQMAEALAVQLSDGAVRAISAGSHPKPLHPLAVEVMRERGIDIAGRRSKSLDEFIGHRFDAVISLCDRVREVCPEFPARTVHWSLADPSREGTRAAFERTADELTTRIRFLLEEVNAHA